MAEIRQLFSFVGRARRAEYWGIQLVVAICSFILTNASGREGLPGVATVILIALAVASPWMGVAVTIRRLHDLNRSGWWLLGAYLLVLVLCLPLLSADHPNGASATLPPALLGIGVMVSFWVWVGFFRGTPGPNAFGPEPQTATEQPFSDQPSPCCPISGKGLLEKMPDRPVYQVLSPKTRNVLYYLTDQAIAEINKRELTEKQKEYLMGLVWKRSEEGRSQTTLFAEDVVTSRTAGSA